MTFKCLLCSKTSVDVCVSEGKVFPPKVSRAQRSCLSALTILLSVRVNLILMLFREERLFAKFFRRAHNFTSPSCLRQRARALVLIYLHLLIVHPKSNSALLSWRQRHLLFLPFLFFSLLRFCSSLALP